MKVIAIMLVSAIVAAGGLGCDEKSPLAATSADGNQSRAATDLPHPTTQELLTGEFQRIALGPIPMSAHVPKSWSVKMLADNLYFLKGPTPAGEVQIQIAERPSETAEQLDRLYRAARRDADAHKDTTRVEMRSLREMKVFDLQRDVTHPPSIAETGNGPDPNVPLKYVDWSVTYYVPRGSDMAAYELHFFNLPADVYSADKAFLHRILDSVTPENGGLGVMPDVGPNPDAGPK